MRQIGAFPDSRLVQQMQGECRPSPDLARHSGALLNSSPLTERALLYWLVVNQVSPLIDQAPHHRSVPLSIDADAGQGRSRPRLKSTVGRRVEIRFL
jgi:hypothetical protein